MCVKSATAYSLPSQAALQCQTVNLSLMYSSSEFFIYIRQTFA